MGIPAKPYDLNLAPLTPEQLVVLVQECSFLLAWQTLLDRYYQPICDQVARLAGRQCLPPEESADAQQEVALDALRYAIGHYDTGQMVKRNGVPFEAYLHGMVPGRFINFLKKTGRDRGKRGYSLVESDAERMSRELARRGRTPADDDPAAKVEQNDLLARSKEVLDGLDPEGRALWEGLVATGGVLREAARRLGLSYGTAQRRQEVLFAKLRRSLGGPEE
jgi:RNA polymerase sigma factor (sigma-70 family)